jgi:hypothetical protein
MTARSKRSPRPKRRGLFISALPRRKKIRALSPKGPRRRQFFRSGEKTFSRRSRPSQEASRSSAKIAARTRGFFRIAINSRQIAHFFSAARKFSAFRNRRGGPGGAVVGGGRRLHRKNYFCKMVDIVKSRD